MIRLWPACSQNDPINPEVFFCMVFGSVVMTIVVWFGVCQGSPAQDPRQDPAQDPFGGEALPNGVLEKLAHQIFPEQ